MGNLEQLWRKFKAVLGDVFTGFVGHFRRKFEPVLGAFLLLSWDIFGGLQCSFGRIFSQSLGVFWLVLRDIWGYLRAVLEELLVVFLEPFG